MNTAEQAVTWILGQRGKMSHIEASRGESASITACGKSVSAYYRADRPITKYHCASCLAAK